MSIKFNRTNTALITSGAASKTMPNGDWAIGFALVLDGPQSNAGGVAQYVSSLGNFQGAGSLNIVFEPTDTTNAPGRVHAFLDTSNSPVAISGGSIVPNGAYYFVFQRSNNVLSVRHCPILQTEPTSGSSVIQGTNSIALTKALTCGTDNFTIGNRRDLGDRWLGQSLARYFRLDGGTLTDLEVAQLAYGKEITDLGKTPAIYLRMADANDITDIGTQANTFSKTSGTFANGSALNFGYGTNQTIPAISVSELQSDRIYQRANSKSRVALSGAWTVTQPTTIEYQLYNSDGTTVLAAWAALDVTNDSLVINANGSWSASPNMPQGGMYRIVVRSKSSSDVLATSVINTNLFGVGDIISCIGSSSPQYWFTSDSGTGYTPAANVRVHANGAWGKFGTVGCAINMANSFATQAGVPVGMLAYGVGGTTLGDWNNTSSSVWTNYKAAVIAVGNMIAGAIISVGSNDAANGTVSSRASHLANIRTLISSVRTLSNQASLPILISGFNRRPGVSDVQADYVRAAENDVGEDTKVYSVQTLDYEVRSDNIHLTPAGFLACSNRIKTVFGSAMNSNTYLRGPKLSAVEYSGNNIVATLVHRAGTDFTPTSSITGFTAADSTGQLNITSAVRTSETKLTLTTDRAIASTPTVKYLSGGAPAVGTPVYDNYTLPLPMTMESGLVATASTSTSPSTPTTPIVNMPTITPTVSSPGFRVVTVGTGKDYATLDAFLGYAGGVDIVTNQEVLCAEVYENQTLGSIGVSGYGGGNANYYVLVRPVPGLDAATLEKDNPLTYGTSGIQISVSTGPNREYRPGIVFEGFRIRFTGNGGLAFNLKYDYGGTPQTFRKCRFYVEATTNAPLQIGESYGKGFINDSLIVFAPTSAAQFVNNYGNSSINLNRNTFVRLGSAGAVSSNFGNGCVVKDNVFINIGGAAIVNRAGTFANNISSNAADAGTGFTIVAEKSMVIDEANNFRPKPGGTLIGAASTSAANTTDVENVSRGTTPNVGAGQTLGVPPDSTAITYTGSLTATVNAISRLRFSTNNGLKAGQTETLSFLSTNFTASNPSPVLDNSTPYVDVDFTFTGSVGSRALTVSATGTPTLSNLSLTMNIIAPIPADGMMITGPTTATGGTPITLTVTPNQALLDNQALSVMFSDADGGVFSPNPVSLNAAGFTKEVTYTARDTINGNRTITATTTGNLTIPQATKVVNVVAPAPKYLAGENVYHVGVGQQIVTWSDLLAFLNGKDNIGTLASIIVYVHSDLDVSGTLTINANDTYPVLIKPAPGLGFADLDQGPARFIPTVGVKLTHTNNSVIPSGVTFEGFHFVFPNTSQLRYGNAYVSGKSGFRRNFINVTSTTASESIFSGENVRDCAMVSNIIIKHGGTGVVARLGDGNGDFMQNTLIGMDGWSGSTIAAFGTFGAKGIIQGNVAYNAGVTPISKGDGARSNFKGNYTNVAPSSYTAEGFTLVTGQMFQNPNSDLRPAANGPLIGVGAVAATSTNDAYNRNYGFVPDAGAIQLAQITPLPGATLTTYNGVKGQTITLLFNTTYSPSSGTALLTPFDDGTSVLGVTNYGTVTFPSSTTCQVQFFSTRPGTYTFSGTVTNAGGNGAMTGVPQIKVLGVDGQPIAPTNPGVVTDTPATVTNVVVSPSSASISAGGTQQFTSVVNGTNNPSQGVTWSVAGVSGATGGSINSTGLFTGPSTSANTQFTVKATSTFDATKSGTVTITVLAQPVVVDPTPTTPVYPPVNKVALGVKYGPTGVEYTGTFSGGNGTNVTAEELAEAVWNYQTALSIPKFLAIK
jgi:hypothetical protein